MALDIGHGNPVEGPEDLHPDPVGYQVPRVDPQIAGIGSQSDREHVEAYHDSAQYEEEAEITRRVRDIDDLPRDERRYIAAGGDKNTEHTDADQMRIVSPDKMPEPPRVDDRPEGFLGYNPPSGSLALFDGICMF